MPIRGFAEDGIVACYTEPNKTGAMFDIDAPRNAPAKSPADHLGSVFWHSELDHYEVAAGPIDVTITHTSLATKTSYYGVTYNGGGFFDEPVTQGVAFVVYGDVRERNVLLFSHGLTGDLKAFVALGGRLLPSGHVIQNVTSTGSMRFVSPWISSGGVYLRELAASGTAALPAITLTYRVIVMRQRAPDPGLPLFSGVGDQLQLGRGVLDTSRKYLRRTGPGDSPFTLDNGPSLDIANGKVRSAFGGQVVSEAGYSGSMPAPPYVTVGVD